MVVGTLRVELHLPQSRSLKAKRAEVRPILDGVRARYRISAAEVDHQDTWQRTALGFAVVSSSGAQVTEVLDEVERYVWSRPGIEVLDADRAWMEED
ncbi:DUF503 domain-containing protein [Iamia majanohamensis]|uniref:DUF503 domain-containing protein n=1 Tax=Iamia majanohamensis TaxID=467976 RepID=A0AAF0BTX9_9ACTN|nr:DUF503 domain-containing protein [Iamia majanohamensis]WCO65408.1 DUF503 domain-containing protein [Iamia majanohamensis]